jgi:hypothetical protein
VAEAYDPHCGPYRRQLVDRTVEGYRRSRLKISILANGGLRTAQAQGGD